MCRSSFFGIRSTDNIGACHLLSRLLWKQCARAIHRIRWLVLHETWNLIRPNLNFSNGAYLEHSRSLFSCESLEDDLSVAIYAEVLCCGSIGGGCGRVLPSGSNVQCSTGAASEYLHCCYKEGSQKTVKNKEKIGRPISVSGKLVKRSELIPS